MGYFRELPNILYQSPLQHRKSTKEFVFIKNIFRRTKLFDYLSNNATLFNKYIIEDGERPDTIADELYGSPDLDFVVILCAGITNITDQWPLSSKDLYTYSENKYGISSLNEIHHYETIEVRDEKERLIMPSGKVVDASYQLDGPRKRSLSATWKGYKESGEVEIYKTETISPIIGISNYEYEISKNESKREIDVLDRRYVSMFLQDLKSALTYDRSSNYIDDNLINTINSINP